jgi:hypothetical protein
LRKRAAARRSPVTSKSPARSASERLRPCQRTATNVSGSVAMVASGRSAGPRAAWVMAPADGDPRWGVNFWVADADAAAAAVPALGGEVVAGPYETPGFREAAVADPAGSVFTVSSLNRPVG